ncbi:MAG TPA: nucleoside-triphosphatase [Bellilinea sp.]|nr:nucleoside-triphosphatase [Bellilinea sp.]
MDTKRSIWLLVGPRECGKTTFCHRLALEAKRSGWKVAGVTMPSVIENGVKTAVELVDLRDDTTFVLMHRSVNPSDTEQPLWLKNYTTILTADRAFNGIGESDLLIFDELHALELVEGRGIKSALPAMDAGKYRVGLVTLRPELLEGALARWPEAKILDLSDPTTLTDFVTNSTRTI